MFAVCSVLALKKYTSLLREPDFLPALGENDVLAVATAACGLCVGCRLCFEVVVVPTVHRYYFAAGKTGASSDYSLYESETLTKASSTRSYRVSHKNPNQSREQAA